MKVIVVGAGYAGTYAANRLAKKVKAAEITVINPRPDFVERIRLHQRVAGTAAAAKPLTSMLRDGITSRVATVDKIGDGVLTLGDGTSADFDYAFLAVGSTVTPLPETVPVGTWEGAEQGRAALAALPAGSTVTVIGGGPTGIETASEVAAARPDVRVRLVGPSVADCFSHEALRRVRAGLARLAVDIVDDGVTSVTGGGVHLRSGTALASDLTLWAIISGVPDLAARSGLEVNSEGRAIVDEYLRSVTDDRIFAVGDCAAVPGARMACQSAEPQAAHAADNLARLVEGHKPRPFTPRYLALGVSLGRKDAVAQFTHLDDTLRRAYIAGRTAAVVKEGACRGATFGARAAIGA
ncbi:dehydrogenase [Acrocarpospora phusangensis]|uniref:Dehydrogenase n=1 Tax=Acrocarpospora phusangensis TaxID=1070424 RepID=A0A919Q6N5_9ACTN|nr:FAD-dependent oxidoreductase [Acrocarpospora phusangensis]GIH22566.1 dehydrogenase [Acrocarpospora phusangensis]